MDDNKKKLVIEQAKQLALTLSLLNSKYDKISGEFNGKLTEIYRLLKDDVTKANESIEFIGQNVAYQSSLDATKNEINLLGESLLSKMGDYALNHDHPYAFEAHRHDETYSPIQHSHDELYLTTDAYTEYASGVDDKLNNIIDFNLESIQSICKLIDSNYIKLLSHVDESTKNLDKIILDVATSLDGVEFKLDKFKSETRKDTKDLLSIVDDIKTRVYKDLDKAVVIIDKRIDTEVESIHDRINRLSSTIDDTVKSIDDAITADIKAVNKSIEDTTKLINNKISDLDKTKSDMTHTHEDIINDISILQEKNQTLEDSINDAFGEIKNKPEYSEILLKTDLDKLKQDIIDAVPVPKDGKDAEEWEFKPHPTRKGVLIFKKQSHKNWNYIDLNHIIPKMQEFENNTGGYLGGGGGASSSGMSVLKNGVLAGFTNIINFIGTGITSITDADNITTVRIDAGSGGGSSRLNLTTAEMISMASTLNTTDEGLSVWNTTEKLAYNWSGTEFLQDGEPPVKTIRIDDIDANTSYIGEATVNSLENVAVWRIKKLVTVGEVTSILWADGLSSYTKSWTNRLTYSYS